MTTARPPRKKMERENETLREALKSAKAHVFRQQTAGKHEQDRADAVEWWSKYKDL